MNKGKRVVRFGVLGCGSIARRAMLPALSLNPRVQLVAVASRSYENATRYAAEFNCEAEVGYENLLARSDIDAVYMLAGGLSMGHRSGKERKNVLCETHDCLSPRDERNN